MNCRRCCFFNCQYYCFVLFYKDHSLVFIVNPDVGRKSFRSKFIPCSRTGPKISREQRNSVVKAFNTFKYGQISLTLKCFTGH